MICCVKIPKSHPRKWVECSDLIYRDGGFGIWESHQRQLVDGSDPTYRDGLPNLGIPPTAVGGWFRSNLPRWGFGIWESHQRQLVDGSVALFRRGQDLNNPPTAVGGIYRSASPLFVERI